MVAHEADVHLRFLRLQLFIDLHSPLDGKLVHRSLFMFNHHTHSSGYFLSSPACQTFINLDSLGFVICHYCSIKKRSFVVTVAN